MTMRRRSRPSTSFAPRSASTSRSWIGGGSRGGGGGGGEPFYDPDRRDAMIPRKAGALMERFHAFFPDIEAEAATAWAGTFGETPDGLAQVGVHPDLPGPIFALGYGGNGMVFS